MAEQAFRVIREAMHRSKLVGIGEVVLHGREQIVALQVSGGGFLLTTLRYASEVRQSEQVLGSIENGSIDESQVELAQSIMQSKVGQFDAAAYHDRYQEAFVQVIKAKIEGAPPILVQEDETPTAYNFLDALRESVAQSEATAPAKASSKRKKTVGKKPAAKSISPAKKKTKRSGA